MLHYNIIYNRGKKYFFRGLAKFSFIVLIYKLQQPTTKVNTMQDFYIKVTDNNAVIISTNDEHISMGVHIRGGNVRIDLTAEQAHELVEAITKTLNLEKTA
jgi:hypothetical protein